MPSMNLNEIRQKLKDQHGKHYWRSLEAVAETPAFQEFLQKEFPQFGIIGRRGFLKLAAASLGLAGLAACAPQPAEKIVPYVDQPENLVPGKPLFCASAFSLSGYGYGILAESHMGRPTKIEGNPDHPASLGATD